MNTSELYALDNHRRVEMKRKWTQAQIDFPWDAITDEHLEHLKTKFKRWKHDATKNNLFRYLLGAHNRIEELELFLAREGYRRCDIPACNCGSYHKESGA